MAIILNGTTHVLRSTSFGAARPSAYSLACWWRSSESGVDNGASIRSILSVGNSAGYPSDLGDLVIRWRGTASQGTNSRVLVHTTGSTYPATNTAGSATADVWTHRCATYAATRLRSYENGVQVGANGNYTVTAAAPSDWIVAAGEIIGTSQLGLGDICMIGYWDIELSAADCAALGKGVAPIHIRTASLKYFVPGFRDANAVIGTTNTATNLTYTDSNPRIYL